MRKKLLLFLLFCPGISFAQTKIGNYMSVYPNDSIIVYFNQSGNITEKEKATYILCSKLDSLNFYLEGDCRIFDNHKKLMMRGSFLHGKRKGKFTFYYKNGKTRYEGNYQNDNRVGIWKYYYKNGNLNKVLNFRHDTTYIGSLKSEKGRDLVINGNGVFRDKFPISVANPDLMEVEGSVVGGLQDGKWTIKIFNEKCGEEFFEKGAFIKGSSIPSTVSPAVIGGKLFPQLSLDSNYYNHSIIPFGGVIQFEHLRYVEPYSFSFETGDINYRNKPVKESFYPELKKRIYESNLLLTDCWFLICVEIDRSGTPVKVVMHSGNMNKLDGDIRNIILQMGHWGMAYGQSQKLRKYFPLVIKNKTIYLPYDPEIEMLKVGLL